MSRLIKFTVFVATFACLFSSGFAQNPSNNKGKIVKWEAISNKNNEFVVYMPEGYVTVGDSNYYMGGRSGVGVRIEKQVILARYINGVVLSMEYYEGNAGQAQKFVQERENLTPGKEEQINGFQVKSFSGKSENRFHKSQQFLFKDRLYIVKAISAAEDDKTARAFFDSVRLTNQNNTVAPNAAGATTTSLPTLFEREAEQVDDSKTYSMNEVDRRPIVLKMRRPPIPSELPRGSLHGKIKLKVLFSSSGTITDIQVVENSSSRLMEEVSMKAARATIFIPAEKDGKLVSVYNFIEHSFNSR